MSNSPLNDDEMAVDSQPTDSTQLRADNEGSDLDSITTHDAFPQELDAAVAIEIARQEVIESREEQRRPEVTPAQAAEISTRPRRPLRRPRATASSSSIFGSDTAFSFNVPPPTQPLPPPVNLNPISPPIFQIPESLGSEPSAQPVQDKGKQKEELFAEPTNNLPPLTAEEDAVLWSLNTAQLDHLAERLREGIKAQSRPGHRAELYDEIAMELQTSFDGKLAAEKAKWVERQARELKRTDRSAEEADAKIDSLNKKVKELERNVRISFERGEEKGSNDATAQHGQRWKLMDDQQADKEKRLRIREEKVAEKEKGSGGLPKDQTDVLNTAARAQQGTIDSQAQEIDRLMGLGQQEQDEGEELRRKGEELRREGEELRRELDELRRQLAQKDTKFERARREAVSRMGSLPRLLEDQTQETVNLRSQLSIERRGFANHVRLHQEATRAAADAQSRRDEVRARINRESVVQAQYGTLQRQYWAHGVVDMESLTDQMSMLHVHDIVVPAEPVVLDEATIPTYVQLKQLLAEEKTSNEQLRKDFADQKASHESLQQSLAECQTTQANQPPTEDCEARLHDLQARLDEKHSRELKEQEAGMLEGFQAEYEALEAGLARDLAEAKAKAVEEMGEERRRLMEEVEEGKAERQRLVEEVEKGREEKRRLQDAISDLERVKRASHVSIERLTKASQDANGTIQDLQDREKGHRNENQRHVHARRQAEAKVSQADNERKAWLVEAELLRASEQQSQRRAAEAWAAVNVVREEMARVVEGKAAVEEEVRNLRTTNRRLGARKEHYKSEFSSALAELDGWKTSSEDLTAELRRVRGRLTKSEATNSSNAEKIRQLDEFVDERLEAFEPQEEEAREEGLQSAATGRPLFSRWREWIVVVLVWFLFVLMVASAARRQKQRWMGAGYGATQYTWWGPESSWKDPEMDLSRGMYGG